MVNFQEISLNLFLDPTIEDSYRKTFSPSGAKAPPPKPAEEPPKKEEKKPEPKKSEKPKTVDSNIAVRSNFNPLGTFSLNFH